MELKIDYSNIPETPVVHKDTYRKPRHVYFGKRDSQTGMMEEEPHYQHQEYPRVMYKLQGNRIIAEVVNDDTDMTHRLNSGWAKNPSAFGYLTAPSWEESLAMKKGAPTGKQPEDIDTGAGEKKWRDMNAQERAAYQAKKQAEAEALLAAEGKAAQ